MIWLKQLLEPHLVPTPRHAQSRQIQSQHENKAQQIPNALISRLDTSAGLEPFQILLRSLTAQLKLRVTAQDRIFSKNQNILEEYFRLEEIFPMSLLTMMTTFLEEQLEVNRVGQVDAGKYARGPILHSHDECK